MKPKHILCLALVLSGGLIGCSTAKQPAAAKQSEIRAQQKEAYALLDTARSNVLQTNFMFAEDNAREFDRALSAADDTRLHELLGDLEASKSVPREMAMAALEQYNEYGGQRDDVQYPILMTIANQPIVNGAKFIIIQPWTDKQFNLLVAGSSNPQVKSRMETITAKWAKYRATDLTDSGGKPEEFWMAAIPNPVSKKICFISAEREIYYANKDSEMMGSESPAGGWMTCTKSYVEMPETEGGIEAAIAKFEDQFDSRKLQQWQNAPPVFSVTIIFAAPADFFGGVDRSAANGSTGVRLDAIDLTDGILRVEMTSLPDHSLRFIEKRGKFWINLKAEKVIKSMVDGQEMDLSNTDEEPFAVPLKKN